MSTNAKRNTILEEPQNETNEPLTSNQAFVIEPYARFIHASPMSDEGFEEWDADFLDQLIQVEEFALSSTNPTQHRRQPLPPPPSSHFPPLPPHTAAPYDDTSYSPPRELSQRVRDGNTKDFDNSFSGIGRSAVAPVRASHNPKEEEIERLKKELGRVSKQLSHLEQDCLQLRKERDKKEEQLKSVFSQIEAKDVEVQCRKSINLEYGVHTHDHPVISLGYQNGNSSNDHVGSRIDAVTPNCRAIGVQTDKAGESTHPSTKNDLSTQCRRSKLLAVWESPTSRESPRNLVSKLLVACETDFHVLFGCLSLSYKATMNSLADKRYSDVGLKDHKPPAQSAEAEKVSHLYSMLTKIGTGMVKLEALFEALVDLCSVENDVIVYRSLRVLHMVLNHTFGLEMESHTRNNVTVEGPWNNTADTCESERAETESLFSMGADGMSESGLVTFGTRLFNAESLCKKEHKNHGSAVSISCLDWVSVFELMHQIGMRNTEECVRLEAVSIMNMIIIRSNAYLDREKFVRVLGFQSISHLIRKESGLSVQKQAVHLLYLLLNCPKLMALFCSGCKEVVESAGAANSDTKNSSAVQGLSVILEGLADCVACDGNGALELKLRRSAVTLLAFLASSGKPGFEILLSDRLPKRTNFVALILQMLISEMDVEVVNSYQPPEVFRERTLLIREALILLNRLVSNPQYSAPVLRVLTNSRDTACLTVDIANRLSCRGRWLWQADSMTRQMRESEIVDLARVFKKRVFTFLGESTS